MRLLLTLASLIVVLGLATGCGKPLKLGGKGGGGANPPSAAESGGGSASTDGLSFADMADGLDANKNTALAVKQFWESNRGMTLTWSGAVYDVKASRGRAEVYLADGSRPLYRGYNIILQTTDLQAAGGLKRGDKVKFQGLPSRYTARVGNPVVVTLNNGQIVNN